MTVKKGKKVEFIKKTKSATSNADDWVSTRKVADQEPAEPTKRFTFDMPVSAHTKLKVKCTQEGKKMKEVLESLIDGYIGEKA